MKNEQKDLRETYYYLMLYLPAEGQFITHLHKTHTYNITESIDLMQKWIATNIQPKFKSIWNKKKP